MGLWMLITTISETEGVSVTQMQARLAEQYGVVYPRRRVRRALRRLEHCRILQSYPRGDIQGGRVLFFRPQAIRRDLKG